MTAPTDPAGAGDVAAHATLDGTLLRVRGLLAAPDGSRVVRAAVEGDLTRRSPEAPPDVDATAMWGRLKATLRALSTAPAGFEVHPKLLPFLKKRGDLLEGKGEADWATAEALAFGTLLLEGVPVRLSGQDSGRGTFSQRHAILYDVKSAGEYVPLNAVAAGGARFNVYDSLLSEAAVMGFEFGYAVAEHGALVLWEAQFGDFFNGAQVIVDQFLVSAEDKWKRMSGLVLLLMIIWNGVLI